MDGKEHGVIGYGSVPRQREIIVVEDVGIQESDINGYQNGIVREQVARGWIISRK